MSAEPGAPLEGAPTLSPGEAAVEETLGDDLQLGLPEILARDPAWYERAVPDLFAVLQDYACRQHQSLTYSARNLSDDLQRTEARLSAVGPLRFGWPPGSAERLVLLLQTEEISELQLDETRFSFVTVDIFIADNGFNFGRFRVSVGLEYGDVSAVSFCGTTVRNTAHGRCIHPHVKETGECCLGTYLDAGGLRRQTIELLRELCWAGDLGSVAQMVLVFLRSYGSAAPYGRLRLWDRDTDDGTECENCNADEEDCGCSYCEGCNSRQANTNSCDYCLDCCSDAHGGSCDNCGECRDEHSCSDYYCVGCCERHHQHCQNCGELPRAPLCSGSYCLDCCEHSHAHCGNCQIESGNSGFEFCENGYCRECCGDGSDPCGAEEESAAEASSDVFTEAAATVTPDWETLPDEN